MDYSDSYDTSDITLTTLKSLYPKKHGVLRLKMVTIEFNLTLTKLCLGLAPVI